MFFLFCISLYDKYFLLTRETYKRKMKRKLKKVEIKNYMSLGLLKLERLIPFVFKHSFATTHLKLNNKTNSIILEIL